MKIGQGLLIFHPCNFFVCKKKVCGKMLEPVTPSVYKHSNTWIVHTLTIIWQYDAVAVSGFSAVKCLRFLQKDLQSDQSYARFQLFLPFLKYHKYFAQFLRLYILHLVSYLIINVKHFSCLFTCRIFVFNYYINVLFLLFPGSKCPEVKPDGILRLYSMKFCPYAQRTRLVLAAKKIP